jgi:hypothetical protein
MTSKSRIRTLRILRRALISVFMVALLVVLLPDKARSQLGLDPCCAIISAGLSSISKLLSGAVAKPLGAIQQTEQQDSDFEQNVVFPTSSLNQAQALAVLSQTRFAGMRQIFQFPVASATLPAPRQLEQVLLSRNPGNLGQITNTFGGLYGPVMPVTDAPQAVRDVVDMTDAEAQAAMKKSVQIDALADLELQAAEQINQQLQTASPGEAAILDAQASAWLVRANAYSQSAMAELVRVRSIELANRGTQMKFSTSHANLLQSKGSDMLKQGVH